MPDVFPALRAKDFRFRRGQVVTIAAAPNVGKSALALALVIEMKRPALYISADTDSATMTHRAAAVMTGHDLHDIERDYLRGHGAWYDEVVDSAEHLRWSFDTGPTPEDIDEEMIAFAHVYGRWPELLIVDSLYNVYTGENDGGGGGLQSLERTLEYCHDLARTSNAAIVVLHHVTGEYDDGIEPPPRSALRGKVSKIPEGVLTLFKPYENTLGIAVVKNRNGAHDPLGRHAAYLEFRPERMQFL